MDIAKLGRYLLASESENDPGIYLAATKRREWVFISVRWLWVVVIFLMAWLHEPVSEAIMWGIGFGLLSLNAAASILNFKLASERYYRIFGLVSLVIDASMAWGIIFLFAYDFYTAAYAGYVYIIIQASIRFGVVGSLAAAGSFVLGLLGAYWFRNWAYDVRFSNSGYTFWVSLMSIVAISVGSIVTESARIKRLSERRLKDNALISERNRISRDLHDTVLKTLQGLSFEARAFSKVMPATILKQKTRYFEEVCNRTSHEIREVIFDLREDEANHPIGDQLSSMFAKWRSDTGIGGEIIVMGEDRRLCSESVHHLRKISSEALENVRRHSSASKVVVTLQISQNSLELKIHDNGRGFHFDLEQIPLFVAQGNLGIASMKERVELLGGSFYVASDSQGTEISFSIPLEREFA